MNQSKKYFVYLVIILLIAAAGIIFLIGSKGGYQTAVSTKIIQPPSLTPAPKIGSLTLAAGDKKTARSLSENFTIDILAYSQGVDVVGYDILVEFDPAKLEFLDATSAEDDISLFKKTKDNLLILTGTKKISSEGSHVWLNSRIVSLVFKAKAVGPTDMSILSASGKETTKFVDTQTKVYYPQVGKLNITIE